MTTIKGQLEPFYETGTEGVIWSMYGDGECGECGDDYDALQSLNDGDYLTIFDPIDTTKVVWEGNIDLEYETNYRPYPMNPDYGQQCVLGHWVHGIQRDVNPEQWASWFFNHYKAEYTEGEVGRLYRCKGSTITGYNWDGNWPSPEVANALGDLIIKFKNSKYYKYKDVDYDTYRAFIQAKSRGKYFSKNIKDKFVTEIMTLSKPPTKTPSTAPTTTNDAWPWPTGKPHGADVPSAWPFPVYDKP